MPTPEERELIQLDQAKQLVRDGREWSEQMTLATREAVEHHADDRPREVASELD